MKDPITNLRDRVVLASLPYVEDKGWTWEAVKQASIDCKVQDKIENGLFSNGLVDVVAHFSDYIDRLMLKKLESLPVSSLRSKDKVRAAILCRLNILENYKLAIKSSLSFWAMPTHVIQGQRVLWRTSDCIWNWAGDTATDYNRQTKRAILSSILAGTAMVWIGDESEGHIVTQAFLDRRLENVMEIGKTIGTMKKIVPNLFRQVIQKK
jgi:ubiquinone biosynthesis protein COQ9